MRLKITLSFILLLSSCAQYEPDPLKARFLKDIGYYPDESYKTVSAKVLEEKLSRYDGVVVLEGQYKLPKVWDMPLNDWCSSFPGIIKKLPGDYKATSMHTVKQMEGYAFGLAWNDTYMLNIAVIDFNGEMRLAHYEPQTCFFTKLNDIKGVVIF